MDRAKIKKYAPQARRDFREAVKGRLALFGIKQSGETPVVEPLVRDGNSVVIGGRAYPKLVGEKRDLLEKAVRKDGFEQTAERLAYTWFNRMVAIRYMELHGHLDHGYRVLSHPSGEGLPEILEHAEYVVLPGLDKGKIVELKIEGTKDEQLYRMLLVAQCNALHSAMPFLFERVDDETELALPENLLHSDSVVRGLVAGIDEADWQEVEVIGWLYEAYISERYEAVIGKVVASEDIPAATQRFTPKWIVRYLVQNTLGRTWLATYPDSPLRGQMKYYIEPAEQTSEVKAQLKEVTPTGVNPEEITLLDPACGSGHILVEAYDLYKAIYQERGYRAKDIPSLILQKNLFGLEIDDRAAQLASFALLMKARADDGGLFQCESVQPNILSIQDSKGFDAKEVTEHLNQPVLLDEPPATGKLFDDPGTLFTRDRMATPGDIAEKDIAAIIALFENAKTFGSLIQVPDGLASRLAAIERRTAAVAARGDGFALRHAVNFLPLVRQATAMATRFHCTVANPPYMGGKYFDSQLKSFTTKYYKDARTELYACFIQRNASFSTTNGYVGMITTPNWMFLSSFEGVRKSLFRHQTIDTFIHNGRGVFGSDFGSCSFVYRNASMPDYRGSFRRLFERQGSVSTNEELELRFGAASVYAPRNAEFAKIPGSPIAYWTSNAVRSLFADLPRLSQLVELRQGMSTGNGEKYVRCWFEVSAESSALPRRLLAPRDQSDSKWFPYNKGGAFRKWYGNREYILNYQNDGRLMRSDFDSGVNRGYRMRSRPWFFRPGVTWTDVSISFLAARVVGPGFIFENTGSMLFGKAAPEMAVLGFLCSTLSAYLMALLNPSVHFTVGEIKKLPFKNPGPRVELIAKECIEIASDDWDSSESSWDFLAAPMIRYHSDTLRDAQATAEAECQRRFHRMKELEVENNRLFIDHYGLHDELSPEVSDDQITLNRPDRTEDIRRLISYTIGCMMGRYSLDKPGLIHANTGNVGFDPTSYIKFRADDDGILPVTETDWGLPDDVTKRIEEFVGVAWPKETLDENLAFVAESLDAKKGESPRETIRRYLTTGFYKHHLQMYKRRPIYWMFSSGKLRAFQCLVYLHRYNESTLARMRTEYVIPLQGRIAGRIQQLDDEKAKPSSPAHLKKIQKELDGLKKQDAELREFDEKLKHYADKRIALDLDDGVKVNYGKFGDLLADVKAVTGGSDE